MGFSSRECQIPLIVSLGILRFGTGSIRNPTLCVARDRRSGSTVIPVALLVIFHSTPCVAVKKHLARARPRPNYRPATIPSLVRQNGSDRPRFKRTSGAPLSLHGHPMEGSGLAGRLGHAVAVAHSAKVTSKPAQSTGRRAVGFTAPDHRKSPARARRGEVTTCIVGGLAGRPRARSCSKRPRSRNALRPVSPSFKTRC